MTSFAALLVGVHSLVTVGVTWTKSPSYGVTGYEIHWGLGSRSYNNCQTVGDVDATVVTGLDYNTTYYFAGLAFNAEGLKSDYSEEAVYATGPRPRPTAPTGFKAR